MDKFYEELKRRKVFRVVIVYSVVSWVVMQVADLVLPALQLPEWTVTFVTVLLFLGFPIAVILAWAYEIGPDGIQSDAVARVQPQLPVSSAQPINYLILAAVLVVVVFQVADRWLGAPSDSIAGLSNPVSASLSSGSGRSVIRANFSLGRADASTNLAGLANLDISSDGSNLVYSRTTDGLSYLYSRRLQELDSTLVTSDELIIRGPKISPNNESILYRVDTELFVIPTSGGTPRLVATGVALNGYSWLSNDQIIYTDTVSRSIILGSVRSEEREQIAEPNTLVRRAAYSIIPGSSKVIYTEWADSSAQTLKMIDLETREEAVLVENAFQGKIVSTGHLLFMRDSDLWAIKFDTENFVVEGSAFPVVFEIDNSHVMAYGSYTISETGRLIYIPITESESRMMPSSLTMIEDGGWETPIGLPLNDYRDPVMAPSGNQLAVRIDEPNGDRDLWVFDFVRNSTKRVTFINSAQNPIWSAFGDYLYFEDRTRPGIWAVDADGSSAPELVLRSSARVMPQAVSPDGKYLIYSHGGFIPWDLYSIDLTEANPVETPLITSPFNETHARISPNGRWIAYVSDETGEREVYIRSYPDVSESRERVSLDSGWEPLWSADGSKIFYINLKMQSILFRSIIDEEELIFGEEETFGPIYSLNIEDNPNFAILPNGNSAIVMKKFEESGRELNAIVIENWFSELEELAADTVN